RQRAGPATDICKFCEVLGRRVGSELGRRRTHSRWRDTWEGLVVARVRSALCRHGPCNQIRWAQRLAVGTAGACITYRTQANLAPMAKSPNLWEYLLAFRRHLFAAMSGGVSVPFAVAGVWVD